MEPKFQSSFIPKGSIVSSNADASPGRKNKEKSLLAFLSLVIFIISVILAAGVFGYKLYLKYSIDRMGADLNKARATLQSETIRELTRLDNRIVSTKDLISKHRILTPLFEFLETSTSRGVRFRDFRYSMTGQDIELQMRGEARGYAALALQADIFSKSEYFKNSIFSDLNLNERGEVLFSFKTTIDPSLVSYTREVERINASSVILPPSSNEQIVSTSTDSGQASSSQNTQN